MKIPASPPPYDAILERLLGAEPEALRRVLQHAGGPLVDGRYRHWDKLRRLREPPGLTHEEWWTSLKLARMGASRNLPVRDEEGRPFRLALVDPVLRFLHRIDSMAGMVVSAPDGVVHPEERERHLRTSLMEEAITSSQLEGAATTRKVAVEMLRSGRDPRTDAERMIFNNYATITWLRTKTGEDLGPELLLELHRRMTAGTLDDPADEGRFRTTDDVRVRWLDEVVHQPPPASQLKRRLTDLCRFANQENTGEFVHPVIRAILVHFLLAYEHPFVDGNGRTARALFYWSMQRSGYWTAEFLPISRIILAAPAKYARAFLYSESDDNDLTYFALFHLGVLDRALVDLHAYLEEKSSEQRAIRTLLANSTDLNHRQVALLTHARRHPSAEYTIEGHSRSQGVVYQTARTDLLDLARRRLLVRYRIGKRFGFRASEKLEQALAFGSRSKAKRRRQT